MSDYQTDWLDEIDARVKAATPGPWVSNWEEGDRWFSITGAPFDDGGHWLVCPEVATVEGDDAEFIAHSRVDVARLISEVRRYRDEQGMHTTAKYWAEIQRLRAQVAELKRQLDGTR